MAAERRVGGVAREADGSEHAGDVALDPLRERDRIRVLHVGDDDGQRAGRRRVAVREVFLVEPWRSGRIPDGTNWRNKNRSP